MINLLKDIDKKLIKRKKNNSDKDQEYLQYLLSCEIIANSLGLDWLQKNVFSEWNQENQFLVPKNDSDIDGFLTHSHVVLFGDLIYTLKDCKGFDYMISCLNTKNLKSCFWEMSVAQVFLKNDYKIEFIKEKGIRGDDYDLKIFNDSSVFHVEAKSRDNPVNNIKSLKNVLTNSRDQLPKNGNGVIYISIPIGWTKQVNAVEDIEEVIFSFFRNTSRVKFIVIEWEEWISLSNGGKSQVTLFKSYNNPRNDYSLNLKLAARDNDKEQSDELSYWKKLFTS